MKSLATDHAKQLEDQLAEQEERFRKLAKKAERMVGSACISASDSLDVLQQALNELNKRLKQQKAAPPAGNELEVLAKERDALKEALDTARDDVSCLQTDRQRQAEDMELLKAQLSIRSEKAQSKKRP